MSSKITKISYGRSIKRQVASYEPMEANISIEAVVEGDDWKTAFKELRAKVKKIIDEEDKLLAQYAQIRKAGKWNMSSGFRELDEAERAFSAELDKL